MEKTIIEQERIVHHSPMIGRTDTFEIVGSFPQGYIVWNIGRHNFPFPGYIPLAKPSDEPHHIRLDSLRALKVRDEETALRILKAAGRGEVNRERFISLSA